MDFNEGDILININELKSALFDMLAQMSRDDDTDGEDVVVATKTMEKCLAIVERVGSRMA